MIEPKIIQGIAFGAACLLGTRSCYIKGLNQKSEICYISEIASHINEIFLEYGYTVGADNFYDLRLQYLSCDPKRMQRFFNSIAMLYAQNRNLLQAFWENFNGREINYANFEPIKNNFAVGWFLTLCVKSLALYECTLNKSPQRSIVCKDYIQLHPVTTPECFDHLLRGAIKLRFREGNSQAVTPGMNQLSPRLTMR